MNGDEVTIDEDANEGYIKPERQSTHAPRHPRRNPLPMHADLDGGAPGSTQATSELHVLLLDSNALGMDGAQVGVVEKVDKEGLGGLLQGHDGLTLPAAGSVLIGDGLGDLADLERGELVGVQG